jgi:hypothetical protein
MIEVLDNEARSTRRGNEEMLEFVAAQANRVSRDRRTGSKTLITFLRLLRLSAAKRFAAFFAAAAPAGK